jgi:predicted signal transduction protein with EAL and GGDEF domain
MHSGAPIPLNEARRLTQIAHLCVNENASDPVFDEIVAMAAEFFQAPIALVSIVDKHRQWFRAQVGLEVRQTAREVSFCAYTILYDQPLEILDATQDERFRNNPLVTGHPGIRYYAGAPLISDDGLRLGSLCIIDTQPRPAMSERDATMLKRLASLVMKHIVGLRNSSYLDQTSGLYNRHRLEEDVRQAMASSLERRLVIADMFTAEFLSDVVKALGYGFVQDLLVEIKDRLVRHLPDGCLLYKVSPTRFGFLLSGDSCDEALCRSLLDAFEAAVHCHGIPVQMQLGIGVVDLDTESGPEQDWVRRAISTADDARDRHLGWSRYQPQLDAARQQAFRLLSGLTEAVQTQGQLRLVYQPRVDLATGACTSVEALLRWTHPSLGPVGPAEFIPLAEKTALMRPLSLWVLRSAVEQAAAWQAAGLDLRIAINVTPQDLSSPDFTECMIALLDQHGIPPSRFELEFTEGALM